MPVSKDFQSIYTKEWEISIAQCSINSKLKYTELSNLFQLTAAKHSDLGGMSFFDMQTNDQAWVSSRIRIEINDLPQWHEKVQIKTWIESLDGVRSVRNLEMSQNGRFLAGGSSLWVVLNTKKRRPDLIALSHDHLNKYPDLKATKTDYQAVDLTLETEKVADYKVKYSDLDIVNHVNNVKYLEWCLDYVDIRLLENNSIKSLDMNFLRELNYNDLVSIEKKEVQNILYFYIKKENTICFAIKIELSVTDTQNK